MTDTTDAKDGFESGVWFLLPIPRVCVVGLLDDIVTPGVPKWLQKIAVGENPRDVGKKLTWPSFDVSSSSA
jgi:hypothetical protein